MKTTRSSSSTQQQMDTQNEKLAGSKLISTINVYKESLSQKLTPQTTLSGKAETNRDFSATLTESVNSLLPMKLNSKYRSTNKHPVRNNILRSSAPMGNAYLLSMPMESPTQRFYHKSNTSKSKTTFLKTITNIEIMQMNPKSMVILDDFPLNAIISKGRFNEMFTRCLSTCSQKSMMSSESNNSEKLISLYWHMKWRARRSYINAKSEKQYQKRVDALKLDQSNTDAYLCSVVTDKSLTLAGIFKKTSKCAEWSKKIMCSGIFNKMRVEDIVVHQFLYPLSIRMYALSRWFSIKHLKAGTLLPYFPNLFSSIKAISFLEDKGILIFAKNIRRDVCKTRALFPKSIVNSADGLTEFKTVKVLGVTCKLEKLNIKHNPDAPATDDSTRNTSTEVPTRSVAIVSPFQGGGEEPELCHTKLFLNKVYRKRSNAHFNLSSVPNTNTQLTSFKKKANTLIRFHSETRKSSLPEGKNMNYARQPLQSLNSSTDSMHQRPSFGPHLNYALKQTESMMLQPGNTVNETHNLKYNRKDTNKKFSLHFNDERGQENRKASSVGTECKYYDMIITLHLIAYIYSL